MATNLDDQRPHLTIRCENAVHVLPVATLQNVISGKFKFTDIDHHEDLIKAILADYLDSLGW